jgi:hypothetical protein
VIADLLEEAHADLDVPRDVRAARVVPFGLSLRVESSIRAGVIASASDPLPVSGVVRQVAVEQPPSELGIAQPPVDAKLLGEMGRGHESRSIVHPAFSPQLTHAGVHDRHSTASLSPGCQRLRIVAPWLRRPWAVRACRQIGERIGHLVVEVTPSQLPQIRLGLGSTSRAVGKRQR